MGNGRRHDLALALLYAGEWAFDSVYGDGPSEDYTAGCRETVAHLLACYLAQHGGYTDGFGTAEARDLIDWEQPLTTVEQWEELLKRLEAEARPNKTYRVTVVDRRELSFDVEARDCDEAAERAQHLTSAEAIYDEELDSVITYVEEI